MPTNARILLLHCVVAFGSLSAGLYAPTYAQRGPAIIAPGATPEQKTRIAELKAIAIADDRVKSRAALDELKSIGDSARPTLTDSLRLLLVRDRDLIEQTLRKVTAGGDLKALEADVAAQRKTALTQIEKLTSADSVKLARANYDKLTGAVRRLNDAYAARSTLIDAMRFRPDLSAMWKEIAPKTGPQAIDPAQEAKLEQSVQTALGEAFHPILQTLREQKTDVADPPAHSAAQAAFLGYRARKQVDAYNRSLAAIADPAELEVIRWINGYRDVLGLPALEMDARLQQSCRRHSKEMVDLKFFSPTSPTAANKDAPTRMQNAGLTPGEGWSEALGRGTRTATETFWFMFEQPPYHKAMAGELISSIGVGKWNQTWTVEFAVAQRLIFASDGDRSAAQVQGDILPPQTAPAATAQRDRTTPNPGNNGVNTDPSKIRPMLPGSGNVPGIPSLPGLPGL